MSRIQLHHKTGQVQLGEFALSLFSKTNKLLNDARYNNFVNDMKFNLRNEYNDVIDFIVCEVFGSQFKNAFSEYEKKKGPPLRECYWFTKWMQLQIDTIMCELIMGGYKSFNANIDYESIIYIWRAVVKTNEEYKAYELCKSAHSVEVQSAQPKEIKKIKRRIRID